MEVGFSSGFFSKNDGQRGGDRCIKELLNSPDLQRRIYTNKGNSSLIALLGAGCSRVLDVGCGAGDNAALIKAEYPEIQVFGISCSVAEAELALHHMARCWVFDIESEFPSDLAGQSFDAMIFSHVLEHLREPAAVLAQFTRLLNPAGKVLIAVPNVLSWRQRIKFLLGRFEYESAGVLDDTHLRFFTYLTADRYLLSQSPNLELASKSATGSVPLWYLRRHVLPKALCNRIDVWGCRHWPNLFGDEVLIKAVKKSERAMARRFPFVFTYNHVDVIESAKESS